MTPPQSCLPGTQTDESRRQIGTDIPGRGQCAPDMSPRISFDATVESGFSL